MNKVLENYIEQNKVCTELLFRDWVNFLNMLFENNGRIESILWFDYCKISEQDSSLGNGGYRDTKNPEYMWAETLIYENGFENYSLEKIVDYISKIRNKYSEHNLYPLFYLVE